MTDVRTARPRISAPITVAVVFLLALNLRPAVTSLGAALEDITATPGMTAAVAAVLVALPLWAIGAGGWATPWLRAHWGIHRTVTNALAILVIALTGRVLGGPALLLSGTALACLAIAVIGTVLPVLVQAGAPDRASAFGASFMLALGSGSTVGALVTPPVVAASSWQFGLSVWALLAFVTTRIWQRTGAGAGGAPPGSCRALSPVALLGSPTARALTLYFGLISTVTFLVMGWLPAILRDAGVPSVEAGTCHALAMVLGLPMMWFVPRWAHRRRNQVPLVLALIVPNLVGVMGLLVAAAAAPWVWSGCLGLGMGGLALAMTSIVARSGGDADVTTALSAMVQGVGYVIAGAGALACGLLRGVTGSWPLPLILILIILCGQMASGVVAVRPVQVRPATPGAGVVRRPSQPRVARCRPGPRRQPGTTLRSQRRSWHRYMTHH